MSVGLTEYLVLSSLLFSLGILAMLTRRNIIAILMGVELVLNAAGINFAAFSRFVSGNAEGSAFTVFIILIAAAEAAVALAIVLRLYQNKHAVRVEAIEELKN
jgi:NADH-quinone oxidoreductase subunit K